MMDESRPTKRSRRSAEPGRSPEHEAALCVQSCYRGFRSRSTEKSLAERRREKATALAAQAASAHEAALAARVRSAEYRQLARHCPDADPLKLAAVDVTLESLVGLTPLKQYCSSVRRDCLARAALGDPPLVRNVLISGNLGTGKKLAADILCQLLRALGVAKGLQPTQTTLEQMALDVRRDVSCVVVDGLDKLETSRARVDAILSNFPNHCFIFVGQTDKMEVRRRAVVRAFFILRPGHSSLPPSLPPSLPLFLPPSLFPSLLLLLPLCLIPERPRRPPPRSPTPRPPSSSSHRCPSCSPVQALHGGVPHFRKVDPAWLQLPNYTSLELAQISLAQMRARGYTLGCGLGLPDLQAALSSTWARDVLAQRNAHLASELVQRGVTNRNRRLPISRLLSSPPLLLASDLGLASEGLDSLLAERAAVDREIAALVGMAPLKACLAELRAKVEFVARGADPRLLEGCLNVVLTGNPGAGKTTAARLLFRALRSLGLLKSNVFVERNALELKGTHLGWTCPQVKEMVQSALGGCLFLDEAYALSGGGKDGDRGDSFADEALRTLLTETENNRTSLCVVLAGYREAMDGLMRADPGLVRRFPTTIHLEDYTPAELAAIARQTAESRFGLRFAPGLEVALARHIEAAHGHEMSAHNASLSVALVEGAINRLAVRCVSSQTKEGGGLVGGDGHRSASPPASASMPASPAVVAARGVQGVGAATAVAAAASSSSSSSSSSVSSSSSSSWAVCTLTPSDFLIDPAVARAAQLEAADAAARTDSAGTATHAPSAETRPPPPTVTSAEAAGGESPTLSVE